MSHNLTNNDLFTDPVPTPDILDTTYPAVVLQALQALTNRSYNVGLTLGASTFTSTWEGVPESSVLSPDVNGNQDILVPAAGRADYLRSGILQLAAKIVGLRASVLGAGPQTLVSVPIVPVYNTGGFVSSVSSGTVRWTQTSITGTQTLVWPLFRLPPRGFIVRVDVTLTGGFASHGGLMPALKPSIELLRTGGSGEANAATTTSIQTQTDTSPNTTLYEQLHDIPLNLVAPQDPIDPLATYYVRFTGESSTNSVANAVVLYRCRVMVAG